MYFIKINSSEELLFGENVKFIAIRILFDNVNKINRCVEYYDANKKKLNFSSYVHTQLNILDEKQIIDNFIANYNITGTIIYDDLGLFTAEYENKNDKGQYNTIINHF